MSEAGICWTVFGAAYLVNTLTITVLYHRGLTHGGVELGRFLRWFATTIGILITVLAGGAWALMHRIHHLCVDTPEDAHPPVYAGFWWGMMRVQLASYKSANGNLAKGRGRFYDQMHYADEFRIHRLNKTGWWVAVYVAHALIGLFLSLAFDMPMLGVAYFVGIASHPFQGWAINAIGHIGAYDWYKNNRWARWLLLPLGIYRNFDTPDGSVNCVWTGWLIVGEGWHNNHHADQGSANLWYRWWEIDIGFVAILILHAFGLLKIKRWRVKSKHPRRSLFA